MSNITHARRWLLLFFGVLTLLLSSVATAQSPTTTKSSKWATVSIGGTKHQWLGTTRYIAVNSGEIVETFRRNLMYGISYNFGRRVLHQVRVDGIDNSWPFTIGLPHRDEYLNQGSASFAVGRGSLGRYHLVALFAGVAVTPIGKFSYEEYEHIYSFTALGLALSFQAMFYPLLDLGFGLDVYANLNPYASVVTLNLAWVIGGKRPSSND